MKSIFSLVFLFCLFCTTRVYAEDYFYKEKTFDFSIEQMEPIITDYALYKKFFKDHMIESKVYYHDESTGITSAYFEFEVFKRNFWAEVNLKKIPTDNGFKIICVVIKTNLKVLHGTFELQKINNNQTKFIIKGVIKPYMPLPSNFMNNLLEKELKSAFKRINRHLLELLN